MENSKMRSPSVCVDLDIFRSNCIEMRRQADEAGKRIRAHFKAHRSIYLAKIQSELGADGFVAAKLGEAEVLFDAGLDDILIAYPLYGNEKWERFARLNREANLITTVDSFEAAQGLSDYCGQSSPAKVLIEVDVGTHRGGVSEEKLQELAEKLIELDGIKIIGLCSYNAALYSATGDKERARLADTEQIILRNCKSILKKLGIAEPYVSSGNSPATLVMDHYTEADEIRVGNRYFNDVCALETKVCKEWQCSLTVESTVVSIPCVGHATIDAGSKTLTTDQARFAKTSGFIVSPKGLTLTHLNEEHGYVEYDPAKVKLSIGDRVIIIPNHACVIHNLTDYAFAVKEGRVKDMYPVDARGLSY